MSSSTVLIINVVGKSYIQHADGSKTILTEGMRIPVNSNVLTTDGSSISIQADGAPAVTIGENNSLLISPELALTTPDVTENAVSAIEQPAATVDQVVTALESGQDPFDVLDPTAAVLGGGEGGGSSFTRIIKIIETTTPLALAYPRPTVESPEFFPLGGAVASNQTPELTGDGAQLADLLNQLNDDSDFIAGLNMGQFFTDPDGDSLVFSATGLPPGLTINPITGVITGTIDSSASQGGVNGNGIYNVIITATDPSGDSVSLPFEWTTVNPDPLAQNDVTVTEENTLVIGNILTGAGNKELSANGTVNELPSGQAADHDPDGDKIEVSGVISGVITDGITPEWSGVDEPVAGANATNGKGGGTFVIDSNGNYKFDPGTDFDYLQAGETTTTTITYQISDGEGGFDTATLTVTVTGTNDVPVVSADSENTGTVVEAGVDQNDKGTDGTPTVSGELKATDVDDGETETLQWGLADDPDNINPDTLVTELDGVYGKITLDADGKWTYELDNSRDATQKLNHGDTRTETFTAVVKDENGAWVEQEITVTVQGTNDRPILNADSNSVKESGVGAADGKGNDENSGKQSTTGNVLTGAGSESADSADSDIDSADLTVVDVTLSGANADIDSDGVITIKGEYGILTMNPDGSYTYVLDNSSANHLGLGDSYVEEFTYKVSDGDGSTAETQLNITVNGTNDKPFVTSDDDAATGSVTESGVDAAGNPADGNNQVAGKLTADDVDDDDAELSWSLITLKLVTF